MDAATTNTALEAAKKVIEMVLQNLVASGSEKWDEAVTTITAQMVSEISINDAGHS